MRYFISLLCAIALNFLCAEAFAQQTQTQTPILCAVNEEPVFACTLQGRSRKMVALCAAPNSRSPKGDKKWSFHYLFGRPGKFELSYPNSNAVGEAFTFTHLTFSGSTGGGAYAFTNDDYKYILYSISGTAFARSGLLVQRKGQLHAERDLLCRQSSLAQSENKDLMHTFSSWQEDPDLASHGLPSTR